MLVGIGTVVGSDDEPTLMWPWWTTYGCTLATLIIVHHRASRAPAGFPDVSLVLLVVLACALVMLYPKDAWVASLLVMTATLTSFFWPPRYVGSLIAGQIVVIAAAGAVGGWPVTDLVAAVVGFGNLQVVAALVVFAVRSEAAARRELAVALTDLNATSVALEVRTREAERLRISRDLHDLTGHHLTALTLELEVAQHLMSGTAGAEHVSRARSIAKDLLATVRLAVGEMRADRPSLQDGLGQLALGVPSVKITVDVDDSIHTGADETVALLRGAQEAITNAIRHSDADEVYISVVAEGDEIRFIATDNGTGAGERVIPGMGLTGMAERFESLGGRLAVDSGNGRGITVTGWLPSS